MPDVLFIKIYLAIFGVSAKSVSIMTNLESLLVWLLSIFPLKSKILPYESVGGGEAKL